MIEVFGQSFGILWFIILVVFSLGALARLIWMVGGWTHRLWYFPDRRLAGIVHKYLSAWFRRAIALVSYKPEITPRGFFLTPVWVAVICLNVLLLAQVLEVFFAGGGRITLPWVGTYTAFPLILGILYATSLTVLAILHDAFKNIIMRILVISLVSVLILAESGLAYYRAWLLTSGEEMISPTVWDSVIFRVGPFLAGLIAAGVAITETLVGYFSFREFIEKMVVAVVSWLGGALSLVWCAIAYWLFGFHSAPPPPPPPPRTRVRLPRPLFRLKAGTRKLEGRVTRFEGAVLILPKLHKDIPDPPKSIDELRAAFDALRKGNGADALERQIKQLHQDIERVSTFKHLRQIKDGMDRLVHKIGREVDAKWVQTNLIIDGVCQVPRSFKYRHKAISSFNQTLGSTESRRKQFSDGFQELKESLALIEKQLPDLVQHDEALYEGHRILNNVSAKLSNVKESLGRIEGCMENLSKVENEKFHKEEYDGLKAKIKLFKAEVRAPRRGSSKLKRKYRGKRFVLLMPWNWFHKNGQQKNKSTFAPVDRKPELSDKEEVKS